MTGFARHQGSQGLNNGLNSDDTTAGSNRAHEQDDAASGLGGITVLILEDDVYFGRSLRRMLSRLGMRVLLVGSSEEGSRLISQGNIPELVLADVILPEGDGRVAARRMVEMYPDVRLVFMSAYDREELEGYGAPVDEQYLSKSWGEAQIVEAIAEIFRR